MDVWSKSHSSMHFLRSCGSDNYRLISTHNLTLSYFFILDSWTHLPGSLVGLFLQPDGPVICAGIRAVLHADDDGPSQHDAWRTAAHYRTQQRLAPSQGQSEEAEMWAWGHKVSLHSRVRLDILCHRSEAELELKWHTARVPVNCLTPNTFELFCYV